MFEVHVTPGVSPVGALDVPAHVLVTGASSGVGLEMVRQLLGNTDTARLFAISRHATRSGALTRLVDRHPQRLLLIDADLTVPDALQAMTSQVASTVDRLHLVINAAGVLHTSDFGPEKSVHQLDMETLQQVFALNAFAPALLASQLLPLLRHDQPAVFASLSARVGSIGDNHLGGWYAYRASKAAQNQLLKTFAIEWRRLNKRAACVLLHPGTVDTPLSAPFQARVPPAQLFTAQRAARQLLQIIAGCEPQDNGRFIAWDGSTIEW